MWEDAGKPVNSTEKAEMNSEADQQTDDPKPRPYKAVRVWLSGPTPGRIFLLISHSTPAPGLINRNH